MLADARIEEICRCRGGYRCGYVIETSRMFAAEPVDRFELASIDVHMAKNSLMKYRGGGKGSGMYAPIQRYEARYLSHRCLGEKSHGRAIFQKGSVINGNTRVRGIPFWPSLGL